MKLLLLALSIGSAVSFGCSTSQSADSQSVAVPLPTVNQTPLPEVTKQEKGPCMLTLAAFPVIHGLKPGMTTDEVLALFPGARNEPEVSADLARPPNQFGGSSFVIRPAKYSKDNFTGINQITLTFLDKRLSTFNIGYNGPEYPHVDKFVAKFVEGTSLPAVDQWEAHVGLDAQLKVLKCADFEVRVFAGGEGGNLNYILVQDLEADKTLKARRKKAREQATPTPGNQ